MKSCAFRATTPSMRTLPPAKIRTESCPSVRSATAGSSCPRPSCPYRSSAVSSAKLVWNAERSMRSSPRGEVLDHVTARTRTIAARQHAKVECVVVVPWPPWQRRTNVWRKVTNPWDRAKRLRNRTANETGIAMKRCAQCHGKLGLGVRSRNVWNGRWWVHVLYCSTHCEALHELERYARAKRGRHAFIPRSSPQN
jgi:hypothetical protein